MPNSVNYAEYKAKHKTAFDQYLKCKASNESKAIAFLDAATKSATIMSKIAQSREDKKYAWYRVAICQKILGDDKLAEKYAKGVTVIDPGDFESQLLLYQIYVERAAKKRGSQTPVRDITGMVNRIIETAVVVNQTNGPILDASEAIAKIIKGRVSDKSTSLLVLIQQISVVISEVIPVLQDNVIGNRSVKIRNLIFESVSTFFRERQLDETNRYLEDEYNHLATLFNEAVILYRS